MVCITSYLAAFSKGHQRTCLMLGSPCNNTVQRKSLDIFKEDWYLKLPQGHTCSSV